MEDDEKSLSGLLEDDCMVVAVPTEIIPFWFIERWKKENAEPGSALDVYLTQMIKDWKLEEIRQYFKSRRR